MKVFAQLVRPYMIWMSIFILVPMLLIVFYAFTVSGNEVLSFRFSLQNFDHVQRTSHSPTFFVVSMITNLEDIEDDPEKAQFCLVGIYLDNEKLCSYRYELKNINELASMNFFDAMEMLAN